MPGDRRARFGSTFAAVLCASTLQIACSTTTGGAREPGASSAVADVVAAQARADVDRSLADGVFTSGQASRGERRFQQACAVCHRTNDIVRSLLRSGIHETVADMFELISTTMPQMSPGSLSPEEYAEILAFLFRSNDYPGGEQELPTDLASLEHLRIDAP